ncbi:MAG: hypothetical protein Q9165_002717 [Trypethelium subeluteriae]
MLNGLLLMMSRKGAQVVSCKDIQAMRNKPKHVGLATLTALALATAASSKQPNIVFILTDDQDARMNSLDYMPKVQKYLINEGTQFQKHYAHVALCCPSRVTLWTGQHAVRQENLLKEH